MNHPETPVGARTLLASLALLLAVFAVTHVARFPGSVAHFREVTGGQQILDLHASFSADQVYDRLQAMGETGRAAYLRLILVVDIAFPLSAFAFLFSLVRFTARRLRLPPHLGRSLMALPVAYLTLDFIENVFVLNMLLAYPARLDPLAAVLGFFTRGKRVAMLASFLIPLLLLLGAMVLKLYRRAVAPRRRMDPAPKR
jgi:hypothetical protein